MRLEIKLAQLVRRVLTVYRKYRIVKTIKKRSKVISNFKGYKFNPCFRYKTEKNDKRPFGIVLGVNTDYGSVAGIMLRCGCYYAGYRSTNLDHVYNIHFNNNIPCGNILMDDSIIDKTPQARARSRTSNIPLSSGVAAIELERAMELTREISRLNTPGQFTSTIVKPVIIKSKRTTIARKGRGVTL